MLYIQTDKQRFDARAINRTVFVFRQYVVTYTANSLTL